ncbi:MAG: leucine-rich repeat domain-containing protein [Ruminococcus sp.]|jgi:hypothetical protein|nr:leucine-rich repeat domain-containing protein [Ruminococcus sp.]
MQFTLKNTRFKTLRISITAILLCLTALAVFSVFSLRVSADLTEGNYTYQFNGTNATLLTYKGNESNVIIPSRLGGYAVGSINASAFLNKTSLTSVTIPYSVTDLGNQTFGGCTNLQTVTFESPSNITYFGNNVFNGCTSLTTINAPFYAGWKNTILDSYPNVYVTGMADIDLINCTVTVNGSQVSDGDYVQSGDTIVITPATIQDKTFNSIYANDGTNNLTVTEIAAGSSYSVIMPEITDLSKKLTLASQYVTINGAIVTTPPTPGASVTIELDTQFTSSLIKWFVADIDPTNSSNITFLDILADPCATTTTFTVPTGKNITILPLGGFDITAIGGSVQLDGDVVNAVTIANRIPELPLQFIAVVDSSQIPAGYEFDRWVCTAGGAEFANASSPNTKILTDNLTGDPVVIEATYKVSTGSSGSAGSYVSVSGSGGSGNVVIVPEINVPGKTETPSGSSADSSEITFTAENGAVADVTETETGVEVSAGVNESGSVNSQATAVAVAEAAKIARENGETSVTIKIPEGATGLSKSTVKKLADAAGGMSITLELTAILNGEVVGGVTLPINENSKQILTGMTFNTKRTESVENFITNKWDTEVLGSFETAQKGGWGDIATISVSIEKLGFEADDGTKLYALIYDQKNNKWYEVPAEIEGGNVVFETKQSGIITILTESVGAASADKSRT